MAQRVCTGIPFAFVCVCVLLNSVNYKPFVMKSETKTTPITAEDLHIE